MSEKDMGVDYTIENLAPDSDVIHMTFGANADSCMSVTIDRDENGVVTVLVVDNMDGSERRMVLGQSGYTEKV